MKLPNFLIIGGVASGTTFLHKALSNHYQIFLTDINNPEPNFFHFSQKYEKGMNWYSSTWFDEVTNEIAIGDHSSLIFTSALALKRLKKELPNIKVIICLRNPMERTWANYRYTLLNGLEKWSFKKAIRNEAIRTSKLTGKWREVKPFSYIERSMYSKYINLVYELYDKSNILILKSESLNSEFDENMRIVLNFLGVDSSIEIPKPILFTSPSIRNRSIQVMLRKAYGDKLSIIVEAIRRDENILNLGLSFREKILLIILKLNLRHYKDVLKLHDKNYIKGIMDSDLRALSKILPFSIYDWN